MPPRPDHDKLEQPSFSTDENGPNIYSHSIWDKASGRHKFGSVARVLLNLYGRVDKKVAPKMLKQTAEAFMFSAPDVVDPVGSGAYDTRVLGMWEPVKSLGQGGFGKVGLWALKNQAGDIVDEIAIKEARLEDHGVMNAGTKAMREAGIAEEAVFQAGLQVKERRENAKLLNPTQPQAETDTHILHLRRYKFHRELSRTRFYMLYAPHRTLADLTRAYSAFDQPLPEAFVWVLFYSLISALYAQVGPLDIDSPLFKFREQPRDPDQDSVLHCDIKPVNIVLDYSAIDGKDLDEVYATHNYPDDFSRLYPRVCLMDYGIALDLSDDGGGVPHENYGTHGYQTPEQLQWGKSFQEPPNPSSEFSFTLAHDVWLIGKVILDLMADWDWHVVGARMTCTEDAYHLMDKHFLAKDLPGFRHQIYSQKLRDLVRDCVTPDASKRPDVEDVYALTQAEVHRQNAEFKAATKDKKAQYRLFFRDQDIHKIPVGRGPFPKFIPEELWGIQDRNPEVNYPLPLELFGNFDPALGLVELDTELDPKKPPYPDRMEFHNSHVSFGGPEAPPTGQDASKGQDDDEREDRPDVPQATNAVPPDAPPSNASVTSQTAEVQDLLETSMNDLRKRLRKLKPDAKLSGKGITKKFIAKEIAKARRQGPVPASDPPAAGDKSNGKKGKSKRKGR